MRFRIVNQKNNDQRSQKEEDKDLQTRPSSGNKYNCHNSFLQMVKKSYDFYMTLGKDQLKQQQLKVALQKEGKLKKLIKKSAITQKRQQKRPQHRNTTNQSEDQSLKQSHIRKDNSKTSVEPSRRSQRTKFSASYTEPNLAVDDKEIFDVLDIDQGNSSKIEPQVSKQSIEVSLLEKRQSKNQIIIEKIQKMKEELIFQDQGTHEIGLAHEAILKVQKFIDEHINFRHEIRQSKFVELGALIKYVKSHGFVTFDEKKFNLLTKINPYLYNFSQSDQKYLMTFKLNGLEIQKRVESTRRRMTQVYVPELFT